MHKDKNGPVVQRSHYSYNAFIKSYERDGTVKSFRCQEHKFLAMNHAERHSALIKDKYYSMTLTGTLAKTSISAEEMLRTQVY